MTVIFGSHSGAFCFSHRTARRATNSFRSPSNKSNFHVRLARADDQMGMIRHQDPSPKIDRPIPTSLLQSFEKPLPHAFFGKERKSSVTRKCQLARYERLVI